MAHYTSNPPALSTAGRAFLYVYVRLWPFSLIYRGILLPHANATSPKSHAPVPPWGTLDGDEKSRTQNPRKPCYARLFFGFWVLRPPSKVPQRGGVVVPPPSGTGANRCGATGPGSNRVHTRPCTRPPEAGPPALARAGMVYPPALRAGLTSHGPAGRDLVRQEGWPPSRQVVYRRPWPAHQRGPHGHAAGPRPAAGPAGG